jgi:signal transduction histidine kinase
MPKDLATPEDLLSAVDAAKILGLSADMVRILAREGRLPAAAQTTRGVRLFRRSEVEQLASERAGLVHSDHAVQFYDSKDFLSGFVANFVAAALRARAPVVIIARDSLRKTFASSNGGLGFDVNAACDSGQLGLYDAAEILATFMVGGRPDRALFRDSIGDMVRKATVSRPRARLRIYGEMVDLLWSEGHHEAAVELEELWNDLARDHSFALLCAYNMGNFGHAGQEEQFEAICRAHTSVTPAESFRAGAVEVERHRQIARMQQRTMALKGQVQHREQGNAMHDLLGAVGRDLRAPLAAIQTAVETMRARAIADQEQRALEQQVGSALRVVDDLVEFSRVARGEIVLRRERVEVAGLVARAADSIASLLADRGVRLDMRVPTDLAVEADADRMVQALSQILASAARRSGPGAAVAIDAALGGSSVHIAVKDDADGMPLEPAERIFDPLTAGAGTSGTVGFGLAIARDLVRLHGGTVVVTSGPGRGRELTVSLPAAASSVAASDGDGRAAAAPPRPRRDSGGGPAGPRRILIVDDNEDLASLMSELLQVHGHTVEMAHEGRAALDLATTFEPDIALLDIGLPGMDGYELARHMSKLCHGSIRLIAITGYAQETDRHRSREAGFSGHLVKPVDPATLARLIEDG